jgi:adenylate cyclase class 2
MHIETEAKLKVDSLSEIKKRLLELGAEFVEERLQQDSYFDDETCELTKTDCCLRLRRQSSAGGEKLFLTFKGPRQKGKFKTREEIEFELNDISSAERLFSALGYKKFLAFEKKRNVWMLGGCSVELDELPILGTFVEIEGPDSDKIAEVQKKLDLESVPHIKESYAALVVEKNAEEKA